MPLELHIGGLPQGDFSASHFRSVLQNRLDPVLSIYWINTWPKFLENGFSFVAVMTWEDGREAMHEINNTYFAGCQLKASWSRTTMQMANQSKLGHMPDTCQQASEWDPLDDTYPIPSEDCAKLFNQFPNGYPPFTAARHGDKGTASTYTRSQDQDPQDQAKDSATGSWYR